MSKKTYTKPTVASRTTTLGVFGAYGDGSDGGRSLYPPQPHKPLTDRNLHLE